GFARLRGGVGGPVERMAESRKQCARLVEELRPACTPEVGVQGAVYVTEDDEDARDAAEHARWNTRVTLSLRNHYEKVERGHAVAVPMHAAEPSTDDLLERFLVVGSPDTGMRQIQRIQDIVWINHFN